MTPELAAYKVKKKKKIINEVGKLLHHGSQSITRQPIIPHEVSTSGMGHLAH